MLSVQNFPNWHAQQTRKMDIAIAPADGANVEELMSSADLALYDAKDVGGNVYRLFIPVLRAGWPNSSRSRGEIKIDLKKHRRFRIENDHFPTRPVLKGAPR